MGRYEIRDKVLLLASLFREPVKQLLEAIIGANTRLHHLVQRSALGMLRRNFQVAADMMRNEFPDVFRIFNREVVAKTGGNQHLLDTRQCARLTVERRKRGMIGIQVAADSGEDAARAPACSLDFAALAGKSIHVRRRTAEIGDNACKSGYGVTNLFDFLKNRLFRAILNNAAFMLGYGAEGTATETTTHDIYRESDHFICRDARIAVRSVRHTCVWHAKNVVHLGRAQGQRRRIDPEVPLFVCLYQGTLIARVCL